MHSIAMCIGTDLSSNHYTPANSHRAFIYRPQFMRKPNIIVYLDVTPEESHERIKMRARDCESALPLEYLRKLSKAYEDFLEDISQLMPVLRVNWCVCSFTACC